MAAGTPHASPQPPSAADVRATLHRLVDALPEDELAAAQRLLEELAGIQPSGPRDYDQS